MIYINTISISKKKFLGLQTLNLDDINTEGLIYKFSYLGEMKILKKIYYSEGIILARKMYTIELLNSNSNILPNCFILPDSLVAVDEKVVGFALPYVNGVTLRKLLDDVNIDLNKKIKYLKQVGSILNKMVKIRDNTELKHFYLNDIHESNFMINFDTDELCVIDLDSCRTNSSFSFPSRYLTRKALLNNASKYRIDDYHHGSYSVANMDTELYCYIIVILNYLYGYNINEMKLDDFYNYLNYLKYIGVSNDLVTCFSKIVTNAPNINPNEFLDSLTEEQVCRAKKRVYDIVNK